MPMGALRISGRPVERFMAKYDQTREPFARHARHAAAIGFPCRGFRAPELVDYRFVGIGSLSAVISCIHRVIVPCSLRSGSSGPVFAAPIEEISLNAAGGRP